jgi:hypothetical protein
MTFDLYVIIIIGHASNILLKYIQCEVFIAVAMKSSIFWDITPCSPKEVNRHFEGIYRLHVQGGRVSQMRNQHKVVGKQRAPCLVYSSTLKMKRVRSSKTSVNFHQTTRRFNPEYSIFVNFCLMDTY